MVLPLTPQHDNTCGGEAAYTFFIAKLRFQNPLQHHITVFPAWGLAQPSFGQCKP